MPDTRHQPALWLDEVPTFEIIDGVGHCTMRSGGVAYEMCFSLATMYAGLANAGLAMEQHAQRRGAKVIAFPDHREIEH